MFNSNLDKMLSALSNAHENQDYEEVAKCYLELGKTYKKNGNIPKAIYYLNRFDNLAGGDDDLYEIYQKQDEKAMQWIEELEAKQQPYEKMIQEQVVEKAKNLNDYQKLQWMLLTMSRFCTIFQHMAALPDFEGFDELAKIVDHLSKGLYGKLDEENTDMVENRINKFYDTVDDVFDSITMSDYTQKIPLPGQPDFVPADLEGGDIGTFYFSMALAALASYIFDAQEQLHEDTDTDTAEQKEPVEIEFVACGILSDYYYRTSDTALKDIPKIQEETARIFSDYDFVSSNPDYETFARRIDDYKKIMLI